MHAEPFVIDPRKARCSRLRRTVKAAASQLDWEADQVAVCRGERGFRKTFITLTYRRAQDWEPRHVSDFLRLMRQWFHRRGEACRFVWVAELQQRGALHYHLVVWVPRRLRLPCPDRCGWWQHGSSKIETARSPIGYMVKYATKTRAEDLAKLPKGVRLHGNGGAGAFSRSMIRLSLWPAWLRERNEQDCFLRFVPTQDAADGLGLSLGFTRVRRCRGGVVDADTGEFFETPWRVEINQGVVTAHRRTETVQ